MEREKSALLEALTGTGIKVLQPTSREPLVPSIITFKLEPPNPTTQEVKDRLQSLRPPITFPSVILEDKRPAHLRIALDEIKPKKPEEIRKVAYEIRRALGQ